MLNIPGNAASITVRKVLCTCDELGLSFAHADGAPVSSRPRGTAFWRSIRVRWCRCWSTTMSCCGSRLQFAAASPCATAATHCCRALRTSARRWNRRWTGRQPHLTTAGAALFRHWYAIVHPPGPGPDRRRHRRLEPPCRPFRTAPGARRRVPDGQGLRAGRHPGRIARALATGSHRSTRHAGYRCLPCPPCLPCLPCLPRAPGPTRPVSNLVRR